MYFKQSFCCNIQQKAHVLNTFWHSWAKAQASQPQLYKTISVKLKTPNKSAFANKIQEGLLKNSRLVRYSKKGHWKNTGFGKTKKKNGLNRSNNCRLISLVFMYIIMSWNCLIHFCYFWRYKNQNTFLITSNVLLKNDVTSLSIWLRH